MLKKQLMPLAAIAAFKGTCPPAIIGSVRGEGSASSLEQMFERVSQKLADIDKKVEQTADGALTEAKRAGELSAETKAKADELLQAQGALKDAQSKIEDRLKVAEEQNLALEQQLAAGGRRGDRGAAQSLGSLVVNDPEFKAFAAAGGNGTQNLTVHNAITSAAGSGGGVIWSDREENDTVRLPMQSLPIRALLTQGRVSSNLVQYSRQTERTNNAGPKAETAQMAESNYVWGPAEAPVRTIGHFVHVSEEAMRDSAILQSEIDGELRYGLDFNEEAQILAGDGTGQNLNGLIGQASSYDAARETKVTNVTVIDKLRIAILQASLNLYPADGIVLNPEDWMVIETTKDAQNRYIFANPTGIAGPILWGRSVVSTLSMEVDKFLVGAFRMAATIYDREDTEVLISSEDRDNFITGMLTVRAKKRLALAVKRPTALIHGDLGLVP